MMETAQVLSDAANLIERNGLHKGESWPGAGHAVKYHGGPCCIVGSLLVTLIASDPEPEDETVLYAIDAIEMVIYGAVSSGQFISTWNDAPERTAEQVVSALRSAAEFVRGGV